MEHLRVIAHEGEVVVGLIKKCIRGAGYRRRRAQRGKRGRGARQSRAERAAAPTPQHRRWDCGNCIGGEEVAATLRDSGISLGLFFLCRRHYSSVLRLG